MEIYEIKTDELEKNFSDKQVKAYMELYKISYLEAVTYLYFYNYASVQIDDFKFDCGRPMFLKFAKVLPKILRVHKCQNK